ncbi:MAG: hypothetical protein SOI24_10675 [Coriobacteriales bacterium]
MVLKKARPNHRSRLSAPFVSVAVAALCWSAIALPSDAVAYASDSGSEAVESSWSASDDVDASAASSLSPDESGAADSEGASASMESSSGSDDTTTQAERALSASHDAYFLGTTYNAGKDDGYSKSDDIASDDIHFGWTLGRFFVTGYTSVDRSDSTNPVFLKMAGDKVALWFHLDQDIDCLNGVSTMSINDDTNGYDEHFGVNKTDFGRGMLIVRQTNANNAQSDAQLYQNYLAANVTPNADVQVQLFEEGDYEVALDYEVINDPRNVLGVKVFPEVGNYKIVARFSVRNGNTMAFLFDTETNDELTNKSTTANGFRLDLAGSKYLQVNVKRETLADNGTELVEDVRQNGPAKDGDEYTQEGVYTIDVTNPATGTSTQKVIYVGTNDLLKAYATTGLSLSEIQSDINRGAVIDEDGSIVWPESDEATDSPQAQAALIGGSNAKDAPDSSRADAAGAGAEEHGSSAGVNAVPIAVAAVCAVVIAVLAVLFARRGRHGKSSAQPSDSAASDATLMDGDAPCDTTPDDVAACTEGEGAPADEAPDASDEPAEVAAAPQSGDSGADVDGTDGKGTGGKAEDR